MESITCYKFVYGIRDDFKNMGPYCVATDCVWGVMFCTLKI